MIQKAEKIIKSRYHKKYILATVHPDNIASLNSLLKIGYEVKCRTKMYDDLDRYIVIKELNGWILNMIYKDNKNRCKWCNPKNELYIKYHDEEWGQPSYEDKYLFEMLILESFQAGLSWECVLNKREAFKEAFDNFDIDKIINYDERKIQELLENSNIIRNKLKINATINNSKIFKEIQKEYNTFSDYIWHFTENKIVYETDKTSSELSDAISKDLKKRGMKFVGTTIIYSYLQAIGVIYSHEEECFLKNNW